MNTTSEEFKEEVLAWANAHECIHFLLVRGIISMDEYNMFRRRLIEKYCSAEDDS